MAGTKANLCKECKWGVFEEYKKVNFDPCYLCDKGSEWKEKEEK